MTNVSLKDLMYKIKENNNNKNSYFQNKQPNINKRLKNQENQISESDINNNLDDGFGDDNVSCVSLSDNGVCLDGCSCSDVEIEAACPFISEGDFESCCCFEPDNNSDFDDDDD